MAALQHCKPVVLSCTKLYEGKPEEQNQLSKSECRLLNAKLEFAGQNGHASLPSRSPQQTRREIVAMASPYNKGKRREEMEEATGDQSGRWKKTMAELALASMTSVALLSSTPGAALAEDVECAPTAEVNKIITIASIAEAVGLIGAGVGGYVARKRKDELERINAQLRQINLSLRRQARVETYAPSLSYAPVAVPAGMPRPPSPADTRPDSSNKEELMRHLKAGKKCLRENNAPAAFVEFEKALELARQAKDTVEEKKAARGLGASAQRQRKYKEAIGYHQLVLKISRKTGEQSGDTEALGAIADCYTELGDLENGAKYYDRYIARLEADDDEQA